MGVVVQDGGPGVGDGGRGVGEDQAVAAQLLGHAEGGQDLFVAGGDAGQQHGDAAALQAV